MVTFIPVPLKMSSIVRTLDNTQSDDTTPKGKTKELIFSNIELSISLSIISVTLGLLFVLFLVYRLWQCFNTCVGIKVQVTNGDHTNSSHMDAEGRGAEQQPAQHGTHHAPLDQHVNNGFVDDFRGIGPGREGSTQVLELNEVAEESPNLVATRRVFECFPETPKELLVPTDRSQTRTVGNKLVVFITKEVGYTGDILVLDHMGISLTIPVGAIPNGTKQIITLVLNWDLSDNPLMDETQALVSPVIYCGPHGVILEKPALLRYKHCAFDPQEIQIMQSQTELVPQKDWTLYGDADDNNGKCQVSEDECQVLLNHFTLFTSIQTPRNGEGKKWLHVAVFAAPLITGMTHYQFRIYFLNKTPCALEWAKHNESQFNAKLACPAKVFLLHGSREDVQMKLQYVSNDWAQVGQNSSQFEVIQFVKIWHGMCPHTAVCFARRENEHHAPKEINLNFSLFQESNSEADNIIVRVAETSSPNFRGFREVNIKVPHSEAGNLTNTNHVTVKVTDEKVLDVAIEQGRQQSLADFQLQNHCVIPMDLRRQLIVLLAPMNDICSDWRDLGCALGYNHYRFLQTLPCPTSALLDYFETKCTSLRELYDILQEMERYDASEAVKMTMLKYQNEYFEDSEPFDI